MVSAILDWFQKIDVYLFKLFNQTLSFHGLDTVMSVLTDLHKYKVFSLGILPLFLMIYLINQKKRALKVLITVIICVAASDNLSHRVFKPLIKRDRPAKTLDVVTLRTKNHTGYSFPSNHATNNFAVFTLLSRIMPQYAPVFMGFAALIAYSRVYVGVHYPFDVLFGALLGYIIGRIMFWVFRRWYKSERFFPQLVLSKKLK